MSHSRVGGARRLVSRSGWQPEGRPQFTQLNRLLTRFLVL
jgi:hypothetical protein